MGNVYFVGENFITAHINPITEQPYDNKWIFLELVNDDSFYIFSGGNDFVFRLAISKKCDDWKYRIFDFIEYELSHDKQIIISINNKDYEDAKKAYKGHSFTDNFLRKHEKRILVHSTTLSGFNSILHDEMLKSWHILKSEGKIKETYPIGKFLGDPIEYSDYIMFTNGGVTGEIIINSKMKSEIAMNIDEEYHPGARLYFDAELIANDGLLVRDGAHLKVKDILPLDKYLLWYATIDNINLNQLQITPANFSKTADMEFENQLSIKL